MKTYKAWGEAGIDIKDLTKDEVHELRTNTSKAIADLLSKGKIKLNGTIFFPPETSDNDDLYEGFDGEIEGDFNPLNLDDIK